MIYILNPGDFQDVRTFDHRGNAIAAFHVNRREHPCARLYSRSKRGQWCECTPAEDGERYVWHVIDASNLQIKVLDAVKVQP